MIAPLVFTADLNFSVDLFSGESIVDFARHGERLQQVNLVISKSYVKNFNLLKK